MKLGLLEDVIRKYPRDTEFIISCSNCNKSLSGDNLISVIDKTDQTYGYVEILINNNA